MLPIRLEVENFYCYSTAYIDFSNFSAAVIVGKINGDDKKSNGSGKSTIFSAIKYVVFNEVDPSSLDMVIKHNSNFCRVGFIFQSSLDDQIYKIVRSRALKTGTDVRLFRKINDQWEDLTQRKASETEKEILKLIKINYRTFCNSVLFAQGDISGIAAMTPRERKSALKEALQLSVYSKYEATTKKKIGDIAKDLDRAQTLILSIGNPAQEIEKLETELKNLIPCKLQLQKQINTCENHINETNEMIFANQSKLDTLLKKTQDDKLNLLNLKEECKNIIQELKKVNVKNFELQENFKSSKSKVNTLTTVLSHLSSQNYRDNKKIHSDLEEIRLKLVEYHSEYKSLIKNLDDLKVPLEAGDVCRHCRQSIDNKAREKCKAEIDKEITLIENKISNIKQVISDIKIKEITLNKEMFETQKYIDLLRDKQNDMERETSSLKNVEILIKEFEDIKNKQEIKLSQKKKEYDTIFDKISNQENNSIVENIEASLIDFKTKLKINIDEKKNNDEKLLTISNQEAVLTHQIGQKNSDVLKLNDLKNEKSKLEYQHLLHQKVLSAFSANGIPALITNTVLDDFQMAANSFLSHLRPGLQLQFLIEKDKDNGEMTDTLDIVYLLNNNQLEWLQLSGAQKLIVSLSLRLGLATIIRKRLGVDLKMILIDEADSAMDASSLEAFEQSVKQLQNDYKILIITHNNDLKEKFNCSLVVEQDQYLNSTIKMMN